MKDFLKSTDILLNIYCIYIIKNFIIINESNNEIIANIIKQIDDEFLTLLTYLLNKDNKNLLYDILFILIKVSFVDKGEKLFILDEKIILNIINCLWRNKNDSKLLSYGILLIKNITLNYEDSENKAIQLFIYNKIINLFEEIYENNLSNNIFMINLMSCLWNLINYKLKNTNDILYLLPSIKIIKSQINPILIPDLLNRYIYLLLILTSYNSSNIFYEMNNYEIPKNLINICQSCLEIIKNTNDYLSQNKINEVNNEIKNIEIYKNICTNILKIFDKLTSLENIILRQNFIDDELTKFLKSIFQSKEVRFIKLACICIYNIISVESMEISFLFKNNTFLELIKVSKNIYDSLFSNGEFEKEYFKELKDIFKEINYIFSLLIINPLFEEIIQLVTYNNFTIIYILFKGIEIYSENNDELLELILKAFDILIKMDKEGKYANINKNINKNKDFTLSQIFERYGMKEIIEKYKYHKNKLISQIAECIYNRAFNEVIIEESL